MCTAIRFNEKYFARTLDFERSFGEEMLITPRGKMRIGEADNRYAMMGIGVLRSGLPLYFDGVNEWGLSAAALNFPGCAVYGSASDGAGVSSSHLISLVLGFCRSVAEAKDMLGKISITDRGADEKTPPTPLHWILADSRECAVVESVKEGLRIYDNPVGVLTNSPELPYHLTRLADISNLQAKNPSVGFSNRPIYSRGMGAVGLPGDFSSASRFLRATFIKENTVFTDDKTMAVGRLLSSMSAVSVPCGCVITDEGEISHTVYTVLCDLEESTYYLTTASCRAIRKFTLADRLCEERTIVRVPIYDEEIFIEPLHKKRGNGM